MLPISQMMEGPAGDWSNHPFKSTWHWVSCLMEGTIQNGNSLHILKSWINYLSISRQQAKKPVHMSQKTLDTLQTLKDEYEQNDVHERDSIGHFVDRQAVKLGLTSKSNRNGDYQGGKGGGRSTEVQSAHGAVGSRGRANSGTDNNKGKRSAGPGKGGRRAPQKQRTCEDCEENVATQFCADCQPPLVLCDDCAVALHRGATRRNHQIKDVTEAPAPAKGYTPKAYRAPFAMLVAFHRAANEVPNKMSLTADELKPRAQPLTNTDLEIKQGRWFGGFDSLENALMKNELVQKEARTPKYSLMEKGQPLAARCSDFDYAVQNLTQAASVPTIPVTGARPVLRNRQLCLLVDSEEPLRERFVRVARQRGLSARTKKLPVGDFLWVLLPPGVNPDTVRDMPDQELVLSMIVERKTWDDLWSSLKTTRFENQVQRMKRCGLENLFYLVEGSPKELKGNPGPEVETYLQDKIDSLLLEDQFLVNRTGSWLKTVEWLCHLTNMSIESLQSGEASLMTYSEFSHSAKLRGKLNETSHPASVSSTVWSATEFTNAIRSHSRGGNELHDLPVSGEGERSLIVIQGLTLYNKQCHKLLDKALADLLENRLQTADACVQRHLQGVTDQLIHQDVSQWYIMWLQVFKGAMVRRTETEEESAEILCKFYQNMSAVAYAPPYYDGDVGRFSGELEDNLERLPDEDVIFASDSQEEDAMIRRALRASEYEETMPSRGDVSRSSLVKPPSSATTKAQASSGSSEGGAQTNALNEMEQLELALELSAAENAPTGSCKSPAKTPDIPSRKHICSSYTPVIPRTKTEVSKSSHTAVCKDRTRSVSPDDELEEVLKLSLEESKSARERQEHKIDAYDADNDLEKALEFSRMEYGQSKKRMGSDEVEHQDDKGRDREQERALKLSKLETETKIREQQHDITLDLRGEEEVEQTRAGKRTMTTAHEQNGKDVAFSGDSDLQKALELSKVEYKQHSTLNHKDSSKCLTSSKDEDFAKALELSRMDCKQLKEDTIGMPRAKRLEGCIGSQSLDANKGQGRDSDLERVLELSRIEYTQSNNGVLDGNDERSDSDIIVLEDSQSVLPSQDEEINDSYIPSSLPSDHEWDLESASREHEVRFDALNPVTGYSKDSAILLDSQEPLDDTVDDFTYALKIQEELNKEINASSSYRGDHDSPSKRDTTCPELKEQLTDYRQSQKEKYGTFSVHRGKSSRGLDFRRNVAAIACGKPVQIGVASPISRSGNSPKGRDSARFLGEKPSSTSRNDRNKSGLHDSPKKRSPCRDEVHVIRDDIPVRKLTTGIPSMSSVKNSSVRSFVSQSGAISSPTPFSSASTFERVHRRNSSTLPGFCSPFSSAGSSSIPPSFSSGSSPASHSKSSSDKPVGPKCGACGEIGHNKNSKMCPHYFSVEAVQRREEQSRKRKAKKEEEERDFNNCVGTLAAERISMEDQTRILAEQLEQLRRQSQSMADTQKKVEDAIKRRRKR